MDKKIFELSKNKNTTFQNLWPVTKAMLRDSG